MGKMRHCHFSILWNEITFLKQKLPFLYENFDQLIFYDLNVMEEPYRFSDDGSHEYIKNFPDPEGKITIIERKDLSTITATVGASFIGKRKMFIVGSDYVWDDIDVFWATDMDEFFDVELIERVEAIFNEHPDINSIHPNQYEFWKNHKFIVCRPDSDTWENTVRVARHKKGNVYGHCTLHEQYPPTFEIKEGLLYHFGCVGEKRMRFKVPQHPVRKGWWDIWNNFDESKVGDGFYGYPEMYPNPALSMGIKRYKGKLPDYIDLGMIA